jgi:hypothetical protein
VTAVALAAVHGSRSGRTVRACIAVCSAVLISLVALFGYFIAKGTVNIGQTDVLVYYSVAHLATHGHGDAIYNLTALGRAETQQLYPLHMKDLVSPYFYPPYFAVFLLPLALISFHAIYVTWLLVNLVVLAASLWVLTRYAGLRGAGAVLFWIAGLSAFPVFVALAQGQASILILALLVGCLLASQRGYPVAAGVLLALALIKPPYVVPFLLVFLVYRQWRTLAAFAASGVVFLVAPLPVLGARIDVSYAQELIAATNWKKYGFTAELNHSVWGAAQALLPGGAYKVVAVVLCLVALAAVVYVARQGAPIDLPFGVAVVCALLINPHVLVHDLTLLLIPAAIAVRRGGSGALWWILGGSYAAVLVAVPVAFDTPVHLSLIALVAIGWWLVVAARDERATEVGRWIGRVNCVGRRGRECHPWTRSEISVDTASDAAEGAEAAVHRKNDACDELSAMAAQPDDGTDEIVGTAKAAHWGAGEDGLSPTGG